MKRLGILLIILAIAAISFSDYTAMAPIEFITDSMRTNGEGVYIFADSIDVGMATPEDTEGVKLYFEYGVTPILTGSGRMVHGTDIKMTMDQEWNFSTGGEDRNAVIRGARIQGISQNNVGGRVHGIYCNARAEGTYAVEGYFSAGATSVGLISIEARTEVMGTSTTLTTPGAVGVLCFHRQGTSSIMDGLYAGIQIDEPLYGTSGITGNRYGIWFTDDHQTAANTTFSHAFGFASNLDADTVAHYEADMDGTADNQDTVDGWISVEIDGHDLYIYVYDTKPT